MRILLYPLLCFVMLASVTNCSSTSKSDADYRKVENYNSQITALKNETNKWARSTQVNLDELSGPLLLEIAAIEKGMDWPAELTAQANVLYIIYNILSQSLSKVVSHAAQIRYVEGKGDDDQTHATNKTHFDRIVEYSRVIEDNIPRYTELMWQHSKQLQATDPRNGRNPAISTTPPPNSIVGSSGIGVPSFRQSFKSITPANLEKLATTKPTTIFPLE